MNRLTTNSIVFGLTATFFILAQANSKDSPIPPLKSETPIALPGKPGKFDFMAYDKKLNRILATHTSAGRLVVVDANSKNVLASIEVGDPQGVAVDEEHGRYFAGNDDGKSVVVIDANKLTVIGKIDVGAPVDAMAFDSKNGLLYVAADNGDHLWIIDPAGPKIVGSVSVPGIPEGLSYSKDLDRLFLNIKDKNVLVKINPATQKVEAEWTTLPATSPHGLVLDEKRSRLFTAGKNGELVAIDMTTGKKMSSAKIALGNDQLVFDSGTQTVYSACKDKISVTKANFSKLEPSGEVPTPMGSHSIALSESNREIWIVYSDSKQSFIQPLSPK